MLGLFKIGAMPTKLRYKLGVAFCLMSLLPTLAGIFIASLFIKFPFSAHPMNLLVVSLVSLCSLCLSLLGYSVTKHLALPIVDAARAARQIAEGKPTSLDAVKGAEELEDLSRSLKTISLNARELLEKVELLSMRDKLTGLYNASYIRERLHEEILRAIEFQRPCSFACFQLVGLEGIVERHGVVGADELLVDAAKVFNRHLSEFDRAARLAKDEFAIIFPGKNKKKTIENVERILKEMAALASGLHFAVGISENPLDGASVEELFAQALGRLQIAKAKGSPSVEAF